MQENRKGRLRVTALSTPGTISSQALAFCLNADRLFVQTERTPCMLPLKERGIAYTSMDDLYEQAEDFDALNAAIADRLLAAAGEGDVVYAVPGRGMSAPIAALLLCAKEAGTDAGACYGAGYAEAAAPLTGLCAPYTVAPAISLPAEPDTEMPLFIEELDTRVRAGEVKLHLMEFYPDEHPVWLCTMNGAGSYEAVTFPLYALDRQDLYHATAVLAVPPVNKQDLTRYGFRELVEIMHILRARCPWDRKQTHESLKKTMVEECYEALDAIDRQDDNALIEELGDVLLQCVFHAEIASNEGRFTHRDSTTAIVKKLIYRHPHIFKSDSLDTAEEVVTRWEALKKKEKHMETQSEVLRAVPKNLPALMRADKVQKKAAQVGFDWDHAEDAIEKLEEEILELRACEAGSENHAEEMGDLLFAAVNVARLFGYNPEELLYAATEKFLTRFEKMELLAGKKGQPLENLPLSEQDKLWNEVKSAENGQK